MGRDWTSTDGRCLEAREPFRRSFVEGPAQGWARFHWLGLQVRQVSSKSFLTWTDFGTLVSHNVGACARIEG